MKQLTVRGRLPVIKVILLLHRPPVPCQRPSQGPDDDMSHDNGRNTLRELGRGPLDSEHQFSGGQIDGSHGVGDGARLSVCQCDCLFGLKK